MNEGSATMPAAQGNIGQDQSNIGQAQGNFGMVMIDDLPVAYLELNAQGAITRANRAARAIYPPAEGELVGKAVWDLLPEDEKNLSRDALLAVMKSGQFPPVIRRSIYSQHRGFRASDVYRSIIRDGQGQPVGMRCVLVDVTEAQTACEEANAARMWLESVLASAPEAILVLDALGFVRYLNPAAEELTGWKAEELLGQLIEKGLPVLDSTFDHSHPLTHRMMLTRRCKGIITTLDRKRNQMRVEINASPVVDNNHGATIGVVQVLRRLRDEA